MKTTIIFLVDAKSFQGSKSEICFFACIIKSNWWSRVSFIFILNLRMETFAHISINAHAMQNTLPLQKILNFWDGIISLFGFNTIVFFFIVLNKVAPMWTIFPQLRLVLDVHPIAGVSVKRMWIVPETLCAVLMVAPTPAKEAEVVLEVTVEDKSYSFKDS